MNDVVKNIVSSSVFSKAALQLQAFSSYLAINVTLVLLSFPVYIAFLFLDLFLHCLRVLQRKHSAPGYLCSPPGSFETPPIQQKQTVFQVDQLYETYGVTTVRILEPKPPEFVTHAYCVIEIQ